MEQRELIIKKLLTKLTKGRTPKAQEEIIATVYGYLREFSYELLSEFVDDCLSGNIWSSEEFLGIEKATRYNFFNYLKNKKYLPIIQKLMQAKPTLGTPNAKTGDYELMFLVTIPDSKKPKKGDIEHPIYGKPNLKGANPRYYCEISGKTLNKKMLEVLNENNFTPKLYDGVLYGQLLNKNYVIDYFNPQFRNSERKKVENVLAVWITNLFPSKKLSIDSDLVRNIIESSLEGNCLIWDKWVKLILVFIFENSKNREETFMVVSDVGNIIHLTQDISNFKNLVNENKIEMKDNFFRLNREDTCAVYLKFN